MYDPDYLSPRPSRGGGLALNAKQRKYLTPSQTGYSLEKRDLEFSSTEQISKRIKKTLNAVMASWYKDVSFANPPDFPNHEYDYNPLDTLDPGMIEARNKSVEYFFVQKY